MATNTCKLGPACRKALSKLPNILITCDTCKVTWHHFTCREPPVPDILAEKYLLTDLWRCTKCERRHGPLPEQTAATIIPVVPLTPTAKAEIPVAVSSRPPTASSSTTNTTILNTKERASVSLRAPTDASTPAKPEPIVLENDDDEIIEIVPSPYPDDTKKEPQQGSSIPPPQSETRISSQSTTPKPPNRNNTFNLDAILAALPKTSRSPSTPSDKPQEPNLLHAWISPKPMRKTPKPDPQRSGRRKGQAKRLQHLMSQGSAERYSEGTCIGDTLRWEHH